MSKILIVEDESALYSALKDKFEREGYEVTVAVDGQAGLQKALSNRPDIVLLDIFMPVKSGMIMIDDMKKNESLKDVPIVLLTNLTNPNLMKQAIEKGVKDYLIKSDWKIDDIVKLVKDRIG